MRYEYALQRAGQNKAEALVRLVRLPEGGWQAELDGQEVPISVEPLGRGRFVLEVDGWRAVIDAVVIGGEVQVTWGGGSTTWKVRDALRSSALGASAGGKAGTSVISATMPGLVVKLLVTEGEVVQAGQPVLILEAMKMENMLHAEIAGVVSSLSVKPGENVEAGRELLRITAVTPAANGATSSASSVE